MNNTSTFSDVLFVCEKGGSYETEETQNEKPHQIITVNRVELKGIPNTITQTENKNGGISRNYYGGDGLQTKQISNNHHGHKAVMNYGKKGEHAHDYVYDDNENLQADHIERLTMMRERKIVIFYDERYNKSTFK